MGSATFDHPLGFLDLQLEISAMRKSAVLWLINNENWANYYKYEMYIPIFRL